MWNALLALLLAAVSLGVILYLVTLLVGAAHLGARWQRGRLQPYLACAARGDRHLQEGRVDQAVREFRQALYPNAARTREIADSVRKHHLGLLSRLMAAADERQGGGLRLMSLARTDRLFQERHALQGRYLTAREQGDRQRLREVERAFHANTNELRAALEALTAEIVAPPDSARLQ